MDFKIITQFKNVLFKLRKDIERKIKALQKSPNFGNDGDLDEETKESEQFGSQLAAVHDYKKQLANVESALNRIEKEKYGFCEKCKKEIFLDILKVVPESKLCKGCKKQFKKS